MERLWYFVLAIGVILGGWHYQTIIKNNHRISNNLPIDSFVQTEDLLTPYQKENVKRYLDSMQVNSIKQLEEYRP